MIAVLLANAAWCSPAQALISDARAHAGPIASAFDVQVNEGGLQALHAADGAVQERDRLWVLYADWLEEIGFRVARRGHAAPWQRVRWQRFESIDGPVELQVRRRAGDGAWMALVIPRGGGSGGAPW